MWAVALVVQQPLKVLSQNLQAAIFAPPFLASDEFETVKYCEIVWWPICLLDTAIIDFNFHIVLASSHLSC